MTMQKVLKQLEGRLGELLERYTAAQQRVSELESELGRCQESADQADTAQQKISELEHRITGLEEALAACQEKNEHVSQLENQRGELISQLEEILSRIDGALDQAD